MKSALILLPVFFSLAGYSQEMEEVTDPDKVQALESSWVKEKSSSYQSLAEFNKILPTTELAEFEPTFDPVYSPVKKGGKTFAKFEYGRVVVGKGKGRFKFKDCKEVFPSFKDYYPTQNSGTGSFALKFNEFFVFHGGQVLRDLLTESCLAEFQANTFVCPETRRGQLTIVGHVGPLVTLLTYVESGGGCGKPDLTKDLEALDLRTKKTALITDFFEEKDLLVQLRKDNYVRKHFKNKVPDSLKLILEELTCSGFGILGKSPTKDRLRIRWACAPEYQMSMITPKLLGLDLKPKKEFSQSFGDLDGHLTLGKNKDFKDDFGL